MARRNGPPSALENRMYRLSLALFLLSAPVSAQVPFNFSAPTEAAAVVEARGAYRVTLDVTGDPVLFCWKDDGLFEKTCSKLEAGITAGYSGYRPAPASDFYDLRTVQVTYAAASWDAEPEWSVYWGCVDNVLVVNSDVRKIHISGEASPIEAICDVSLGGLLGALCEDIAVNDCGTFEGHITGTQIFLDQVLAHKDFLEI